MLKMDKGGRKSACFTNYIIVSLCLLLVRFVLWRPVEARPLLSPKESCDTCEKPNVVLVVCDSFDGRLTFSPKNETVVLPFINLMRRQGSLFLNAYTNSPICCPSRAAMWSGLFTHLTESWNNFKGLDPNYRTWMDLMEKKGYYTKKYGKLDYTSGHHSLR
ncbi:arylsulfatase K-like [Protobothrops mucrosquamatus]|uniref:arylsulfatase K-like n=1 Tax=Protobothrops mucrosquamatus TaxID=103944 RepID=UPI000775B334|nr:arylsulfatase K-like [Protobothrops mucrosquamatus]XP_015685454.1 arylsulfatase K-like [Protobothrops mucrosquamatus]